MLLTVAELPEYLRTAAKLPTVADRRAIVDHLAAHPAAGCGPVPRCCRSRRHDDLTR